MTVLNEEFFFRMGCVLEYLDVDDRQILIAEVDNGVEILHSGGQEGAEGSAKARALGLPITGEIGTPDTVHVPRRGLVQGCHTQLHTHTHTHTH